MYIYSFLVLSFLSLAASLSVPQTNQSHKTCTVKPLGNHKNDVPNILNAFAECGHSGTIVFPENETYWIAERLNPHVHDVNIEWRGTWLVSPPSLIRKLKEANIEKYSDNLTYWRNNSYPISFQNHAAGFILSGSGIRINGHGTGGINGNGENLVYG